MARRKRQATCHPEERHLANGLCKRCYDRTPERLKKRKAYNRSHKLQIVERTLRHKYSITTEEYNSKLYEQNGQCAICGSETTGHRMQSNLLVDHDHKTGKIRGLLCSKCNRGLGQFDDDPELMMSAIRYIQQYAEDS